MKKVLTFASLLCLALACGKESDDSKSILGTCEGGQESHAFLTTTKSGLQAGLSNESIVTTLWTTYPDLIQDSANFRKREHPSSTHTHWERGMDQTVLDTFEYIRSRSLDIRGDLSYESTECTTWLKNKTGEDGSIQELPEAEWKCLESGKVTLPLPGNNEASEVSKALYQLESVIWAGYGFEFPYEEWTTEALGWLEDARTNLKGLYSAMSCDTSTWLP